MEKYIVSVDTGLKGGIAVFDLADENLIETHYFSYEKYREIAHKYNGILVIEKVHAMPHQGVSSMFSFGEVFGLTKGIFYFKNYEIIEITPQKWKKYFNLHNDKSESIKLAHKYYDYDGNIGKRKVIESDGIAEAILIGKYYIDNRI